MVQQLAAIKKQTMSRADSFMSHCVSPYKIVNSDSCKNSGDSKADTRTKKDYLAGYWVITKLDSKKDF